MSFSGITIASAVPDYSDPTLPTIESFSQKVEVTEKGEILFVTKTSLRWKKNRPTIFAGSMGILENRGNALLQPCYGIGNVDNSFGSVNKFGGNSIEITSDQVTKEVLDGDYKITSYQFSQLFSEPVKSPNTKFEYNYCRGVHRPFTLGIYDESGRIKVFNDQNFNSEPLPGISVSQSSYFWNENPRFYPCPPANPALQEGYHTERTICDSVNPFLTGIAITDSLFAQAAEAQSTFLARNKAASDLKAKQVAETKASVTKKKTTIACTKGKVTKKVTAVNPKCPAGYKKR